MKRLTNLTNWTNEKKKHITITILEDRPRKLVEKFIDKYPLQFDTKTRKDTLKQQIY